MQWGDKTLSGASAYMLEKTYNYVNPVVPLDPPFTHHYIVAYQVSKQDIG